VHQKKKQRRKKEKGFFKKKYIYNESTFRIKYSSTASTDLCINVANSIPEHIYDNVGGDDIYDLSTR
jgi:hypothetical protein